MVNLPVEGAGGTLQEEGALQPFPVWVWEGRGGCQDKPSGLQFCCLDLVITFSATLSIHDPESRADSVLWLVCCVLALRVPAQDTAGPDTGPVAPEGHILPCASLHVALLKYSEGLALSESLCYLLG